MDEFGIHPRESWRRLQVEGCVRTNHDATSPGRADKYKGKGKQPFEVSGGGWK